MDWGDRDKAGEMFCGEVGLIFCCDDGGEMSCGDGLMLGAGPSRGWWRETTRGKPGGRCSLLRDARLPAARKAAVILVHFPVASVGAFFPSCVPVWGLLFCFVAAIVRFDLVLSALLFCVVRRLFYPFFFCL